MVRAFYFEVPAVRVVCRIFLQLVMSVLAGPALAQRSGDAVDLQLVLAVDASGSVNETRFEIQKQGYVAAFRHPRVVASVQSGAGQAIAVTMVQWTGPYQQVQVVPWTRLSDAASAASFAEKIAGAPRQLFGGGTSISGAIDHGVELMKQSPFQAARRVIDISGDGSNNRGRPVTDARDAAVRAGVGINGLPILALEYDLDRYYQENVIGGPGAFVIAIKSYDQFADAILKKLIAEIADVRPVPSMASSIALGNGME